MKSRCRMKSFLRGVLAEGVFLAILALPIVVTSTTPISALPVAKKRSTMRLMIAATFINAPMDCDFNAMLSLRGRRYLNAVIVGIISFVLIGCVARCSDATYVAEDTQLIYGVMMMIYYFEFMYAVVNLWSIGRSSKMSLGDIAIKLFT